MQSQSIHTFFFFPETTFDPRPVFFIMRSSKLSFYCMWQRERAHPVAILYHGYFIFPRPKNSLTRPAFHFSRLFLGDPAGNTDLGCLLSWPNILETNHPINTKPTKHFIHTIIKLLIEKIICHGPHSLRWHFEASIE